ncbi:MAG: PDZ domain-containing protein [Opitutus sp.]
MIHLPFSKPTSCVQTSQLSHLESSRFGRVPVAISRSVFFIAVCLSALPAKAADLPALWSERLSSVVAVEFYVENETERRPTVAFGTVIDDQGTIILPPVAVNARITPSQLKDFKVYRPGEPNSVVGEYLGQDALTGWHFVRAAESLRKDLVPITKYAAKQPAEPAMADEIWGIALRNKDEDFKPYLLSGRVALIQSLPQRTVIAQQDIAGPGLPAFNLAGEFLGLASSSFGQTYIQFSRDDRGGLPIVLVNVEESGAVLAAAEVIPYLSRVPKSIFGRPLPWLGAYGFEPVDPEVAKFLKLGAQSALVVSEVPEASPADIGGLKKRDVVLAIDGKPLPRFKPDRVVVGYMGREIQRHRPGEEMTFTVLRGQSRVEAKIVLGDQPKLFSEAERKYYDRLGFTAREMVYDDAIYRRIKPTDARGLIAHFVKPNGPASAAGLRLDDWIKEIDGVEVTTFATAAAQLAALEADKTKIEAVLLVGRGGETAVLRLKL